MSAIDSLPGPAGPSASTLRWIDRGVRAFRVVAWLDVLIGVLLIAFAVTTANVLRTFAVGVLMLWIGYRGLGWTRDWRRKNAAA